jgi:hypothetical protein
MANLRANNVCGTDGRNAITGSVEFDGTGDYLSLADTTDFDIGLNNEPFTWEVWFNMTSPTSVTNNLGLNRGGGTAGWNSTTGHQYQAFHYTDNKLYWQFWNGSSNVSVTSNANEVSVGSWNHFAITYDGTTTRGFLNGIQFPTTSTSNYAKPSSSNISRIGTEASGSNFGSKFQSNIRVIKGTALYTQNFIPPTRKLIRLPGTALLCCQDNVSVTTEATGKTITANGNPTARKFVPQVGSDGGLVFDGVTKVNTQNYFYLSTGPTEQRGRGRGVFGGGYVPGSSTNAIDFINIQSLGIAQDFGDLSNNMGAANNKAPCAASSTSRALFAGGYSAPGGPVNTVEYVTIATTSNSTDFGDLSQSRRDLGACASSTRATFGGGTTTGSTSVTNTIDYVIIASIGIAVDYGDLTQARRSVAACSSPTRGVWGGGYVSNSPATYSNTIDYVTISSTGNAADFGDLTIVRGSLTSCSNSTRGIFAGGTTYTAPASTYYNTIDYITISSTGNAADFGDLSSAKHILGSASSPTRGTFAGGGTSYFNTIEYVTISSTGNASDFGDLTVGRLFYNGGCSDSHGGLG